MEPSGQGTVPQKAASITQAMLLPLPVENTLIRLDSADMEQRPSRTAVLFTPQHNRRRTTRIVKSVSMDSNSAPAASKQSKFVTPSDGRQQLRPGGTTNRLDDSSRMDRFDDSSSSATEDKDGVEGGDGTSTKGREEPRANPEMEAMQVELRASRELLSKALDAAAANHRETQSQFAAIADRLAVDHEARTATGCEAWVESVSWLKICARISSGSTVN